MKVLRAQNQSIIQKPALGIILYQPSKSSNLPFLSRLKKQKKDDEDERLLSIFKQIHINLPFLESMIHMPKGAKVLKDLFSHKEKLEKAASSVKLSKECSAIIQRSLPQKEGDPRSFTLPCLIGPLAVKNALADLGANIILCIVYLTGQLGISKLKPTKMSIQLADRSIKYPIGVCENLLVKISKFIFPVDFVVLEIDEDKLVPIILRRPFLAIARAVTDVHEGKLSLRVESETVTFSIGKSMKSKHSHDDYLYCRGFLSNSASKSVKMLNWYEKTNLVFNWEKCLFMARMDSSLALRSSGFIEVAEKIITNPPALNPAAYDLGQRIDKHFKPIHYASKTMNEAQENYTTYKRVPSFVCAFEQILSILGLIQYYHFSRISRAAGTENLAADHLSRLENPDLGKLTKAEIRDLFLEEQGPYGGLLASHHARNVFETSFYWPNIYRDALSSVQFCKFSDIGAWVQVPRCMAWLDYDEHVDSLSTMDNEVGVTSLESTTQTLSSFEEYTPPVTYSEELEKTLRTPIEPQPQPLPNCPPLDTSLGTERGLKSPIKPQSHDSFRMKVLDNLIIHTPPSSLMASFHLRDLYCYYLPCIDDPKKHYGFKPGLFRHSGSLGVDFLKLEMIDDD
ncbi:reverse transcriptase domain-containing protein [Tanacetum coccineum]